MTGPAQRSLWIASYREARVHAAILATALWVTAAALMTLTAGPRDVFGHLKGTDFVHFYTLGRLGLERNGALLFDGPRQHAFQTELVPASAPDSFVPIYPPQTALLFSAIAWLPHGPAAIAWVLLTAVAYAWAVRAAWLPTRRAIPDGWFVFLAAAGFPPFWNLVLHGQTTGVVLVSFALAGVALARGQRFGAGLALGLLAIKPTFALAPMVVLFACSEGTMIAGVALAALAQAVAAAAVFGPAVLRTYGQTLLHLPQLAPLLEPRPYQLHSLRAIADILPPPMSDVVWISASAIVAWQAVRVWRSPAPALVRMGVLVIASVLINPHLTVYDATVLSIALLWIGGWIEAAGRRDLAGIFWPALYWLFVAFLVPTAALVYVQASVLLLAWLFLRLSTAIALRKPNTGGSQNDPPYVPT